MQTTLPLASVALCNRLSARHPVEKALFAGGFLALAFLLPPMPWSLVIAVLVSACALVVARVPWRSWLTLLAAPVLFSLFTAATLLVDLDTRTVHWLDGAFYRSASLFLRSVAAIVSIAFLGSTTPMMHVLSLPGRIGMPRELVDLSAMIYRFLLVAIGTLREMRLAQSWRMGLGGRRVEMRAAAMLASALFIRCIERAKKQERGLAARGYTGELRLLRCHQPASVPVIASVLLFQALLFAVGGAWRLP